MNIGVVLKPGAPEAVATLLRVQAMAQGAHFFVEQSGHHAVHDAVPRLDPVDAATFQRDADLVLVLGGDGTLIHAASLLQDRVVPILGVNLGRIGLLTEVTREEIDVLWPKAIAGELPHDDRMRLEATLRRGDQVVLRARILNDAVVAQLALARVAVYRVTRGGELVTAVRGDGVIIATPTGSTAYSLAAGGSIMEPQVAAIAVTPICPHALTQRPFVLAPDGDIAVTLESDSTVFATLDGQMGHEFVRGDTLTVTRSPVPVRLLTVPGRSYFHTLRTKLRFGEV